MCCVLCCVCCVLLCVVYSLSLSHTQNPSWNVEASQTAQRTYNPIRAIVDTMKLVPNPDKEWIPLSIGMGERCFTDNNYNRTTPHSFPLCSLLPLLLQGDPTAFPNLPPSAESIQAVEVAIAQQKKNGYPPSIGIDRACIACYCTSHAHMLTSALC